MDENSIERRVHSYFGRTLPERAIVVLNLEDEIVWTAYTDMPKTTGIPELLKIYRYENCDIFIYRISEVI